MLDEIVQHLGAFIELMVTEGHGIILNQIHELQIGESQILIKIQRAGEYVSSIHEQWIDRIRFGFLDCRNPARNMIRRAYGVQIGMRVIGMQNGQREAVNGFFL